MGRCSYKKIFNSYVSTILIWDAAECSGSYDVFLRRNYYVETGRHAG